MARLAKIEGIGETYAQKLDAAGIQTTEALLKAGATPTGREEISEKTNVGQKLILEWVKHADLFLIKGIGEEYADLLEAAGVDTVPELAQRNAENLQGKLAEINQQKRLVRRLPSQAVVND